MNFCRRCPIAASLIVTTAHSVDTADCLFAISNHFRMKKWDLNYRRAHKGALLLGSALLLGCVFVRERQKFWVVAAHTALLELRANVRKRAGITNQHLTHRYMICYTHDMSGSVANCAAPHSARILARTNRTDELREGTDGSEREGQRLRRICVLRHSHSAETLGVARFFAEIHLMKYIIIWYGCIEGCVKIAKAAKVTNLQSFCWLM